MEDAAAEPLIQNGSPEGLENNEIQHVQVDEAETRPLRPTLFVWALTISAAISGLLFGYDTGVISSTLVTIGQDLSARQLTTLDKSLIASSTSLFALISSPLTALLADAIGRRKAILIADVLFILGAVWQAFATSVASMILGRSIVGLAIGGASFVAPMYVVELSPSAYRGRLVTVSVLLITAGQVVAYTVGWLLSETAGGWRWMVGLGAAPAIVQASVLCAMPETPRWLFKVGRRSEAEQGLRKIYGKSEDMKKVVAGVLCRVEKDLLEEQAAFQTTSYEIEVKAGLWQRLGLTSSSCFQLLHSPANRRALAIACMLQGFQQLCGFNSLIYFSATIFKRIGFASPTLSSLPLAIVNFIGTLLAFAYIDGIGRRRILLYSIPIMIIGLGLSAASFKFLDVRPDTAATASAPTTTAAQSMLWPRAILGAMILYVAGYAIGLGNVPWQQSELFPLSVRSVGSGLATATNWGSNFIIGATFLPMMEVLSPTGTFALYAGVCVVGWVAVWRIYPETAGMELEDVGRLLAGGWGVGSGRGDGGRGR